MLVVTLIGLGVFLYSNKAEKITIVSNTQTEYKDLKIGAGNFWEEEYTDSSHNKKNGLTAGLWLYPKDGKNYTKRVYEGEEFTFANYKFKILKVSQNPEKVELTIASEK